LYLYFSVPKTYIEENRRYSSRCLNTKLQKQLSRKVDEKEYPKYVVTIPPSQVRELRWKEGDELEAKIQKDKLVIMRRKH